MNADVLANVKQEVELFRKELVVVVQVEAEKRIGFDKRAAAYGDFSTSLRDQVNCGEVLEDTYRIGGTENGDSAGETDALGARGCSGEENGRCGSARRTSVGSVRPILVSSIRLYPGTG